jgi:hypothetical protein
MNSVHTDVFFDDHATQVMGRAFDRACVGLADSIGLRDELEKKSIEAETENVIRYGFATWR